MDKELKEQLQKISDRQVEGFTVTHDKLNNINTDVQLIKQRQDQMNDTLKHHDTAIDIQGKAIIKIEKRWVYLTAITSVIIGASGILLFTLKSYIINILQEQMKDNSVLATQVVQAIKVEFPESSIENN